jgi:hypothetical protein
MTINELLQWMIDNCPTCRGKGEVPATKATAGMFRGMKPCPYCTKAREVLKIRLVIRRRRDDMWRREDNDV